MMDKKWSSIFKENPYAREGVGETWGPISFGDWKEHSPQEFAYWKGVAKIANRNYEKLMKDCKDSPIYKERFPWSDKSMLLWSRYQDHGDSAEGYAVAFNKNHGYIVFLSRCNMPHMLPEACIIADNLEHLFPDIHPDAHHFLRTMTPHVVLEMYGRFFDEREKAKKGVTLS